MIIYYISRTIFFGGNDMYVNALNCLKSFIEQDEGITAIECGLIAALIAVVIIAAVTLVGTELQSTFTTISGALTNANAS